VSDKRGTPEELELVPVRVGGRFVDREKCGASYWPRLSFIRGVGRELIEKSHRPGT
jgi:hypothetical protein